MLLPGHFELALSDLNQAPRTILSGLPPTISAASYTHSSASISKRSLTLTRLSPDPEFGALSSQVRTTHEAD